MSNWDDGSGGGDIEDKWVRMALSCDTTDDARGTAAIKGLYSFCGLPEPQVIWFDSPVTAITYILSMRNLQKFSVSSQGVQSICDQYVEGLHNLVGSETMLKALSMVDVELIRPACERLSQELSADVILRTDDRVDLAVPVSQTVEHLIRHEAQQYLQRELLSKTTAKVVEQIMKAAGNSFGGQVQSHTYTTVTSSIMNRVMKLNLSPGNFRVLFNRLSRVRAPIRRGLEFNYSLAVAGTQFRNLAFGEQLVDAITSVLMLEECAGHVPNGRGGSFVDLPRDVSWMWAFKTVCVACRKPTSLTVDEQGNLHNSAAAAVQFRDGWSVWCWRGVIVPAEAISSPESITLDRIASERNSEIRRVLMEKYGIARYVPDLGGEIIHRDLYGVLYRAVTPSDGPIVLVKVLNSTPEPDGTFKEFFLRVPPTISTAREAVAWTFGLTGDEYSPRKET